MGKMEIGDTARGSGKRKGKMGEISHFLTLSHCLSLPFSFSLYIIFISLYIAYVCLFILYNSSHMPFNIRRLLVTT